MPCSRPRRLLVGSVGRPAPSSTTTPASPTPRSTTTKPPPPPPPCRATRWPDPPPAGSAPAGSCRTTVLPTAPTPGATPAPSSASPKAHRSLPPADQGQVERSHRTLADGWPFARLYTRGGTTPQSATRMVAPRQPPQALHHHRRTPPLSRLTNLSGLSDLRCNWSDTRDLLGGKSSHDRHDRASAGWD